MIKETISFVLPCYNPPEGWEYLVAENYSALSASLPDYQTELVIVNDGSQVNVTSSSIAYLRSHAAGLIYLEHTPNQGKGYTLRKGVSKASGKKIIYTDIDFPYTKDSIAHIIHALNDADIAVGVRGDSYYNQISHIRSVISKILKFFIRFFLRIPTDDTQGGLKGLNETAKKIFIATETNRYLFDLEFIYTATNKKCSIALVPIVLREGIVMRQMNWKILFSETLNFIKIAFRKK